MTSTYWKMFLIFLFIVTIEEKASSFSIPPARSWFLRYRTSRRSVLNSTALLTLASNLSRSTGFTR